jgi:hypothetical protein
MPKQPVQFQNKKKGLVIEVTEATASGVKEKMQYFD